ncbi:hypothetical protein DNK10_11220 [Pseudomonas daroniae]|nr:hypothetical protein DNK10_11220 [Pseudomonas daroniae]
MPEITLGERLKAERERLGYTQPQFAELVGASKRTQVGWEQGRSAPDANALAIWVEEGLDAGYVLTGERTPMPTVRGMPPDEQMLLDSYRALSSAKKRVVLAELILGTAGKKSGKTADAIGVVVTGDGNRAAGNDYHEK